MMQFLQFHIRRQTCVDMEHENFLPFFLSFTIFIEKVYFSSMMCSKLHISFFFIFSADNSSFNSCSKIYFGFFYVKKNCEGRIWFNFGFSQKEIKVQHKIPIKTRENIKMIKINKMESFD